MEVRKFMPGNWGRVELGLFCIMGELGSLSVLGLDWIILTRGVMVLSGAYGVSGVYGCGTTKYPGNVSPFHHESTRSRQCDADITRSMDLPKVREYSAGLLMEARKVGRCTKSQMKRQRENRHGGSIQREYS
jgi:hypothetical protein